MACAAACRQALGDDELRVEERAQRAVRDERRAAARACVAAPALGRATCSRQSGVDELELGGQLLAEVVLVGEEELELEQVAQAQGLLRSGLASASSVAGSVRQAQQRELDDRADDEVVQRAVAVERGDRVAARGDRPDGLGAAVEALDHAGGHERVERCRGSRWAAAARRPGRGCRARST